MKRRWFVLAFWIDSERMPVVVGRAFTRRGVYRLRDRMERDAPFGAELLVARDV